jgi:hypothetical protein
MVTLANRNLQAAGLSVRAEVRQDDVVALPPEIGSSGRCGFSGQGHWGLTA